MTRAWDKENICVPDRNQTHDLPNTWRGFYTLSYENSWRKRSFNWVHMWQAFSILQGSALLSSSWVVISEWIWRIMSSVMKCERWIISGTQIFSLFHACVMLNNSSFMFHYQAQNSPSSFLSCKLYYIFSVIILNLTWSAIFITLVCHNIFLSVICTVCTPLSAWSIYPSSAVWRWQTTCY